MAEGRTSASHLKAFFLLRSLAGKVFGSAIYTALSAAGTMYLCWIVDGALNRNRVDWIPRVDAQAVKYFIMLSVPFYLISICWQILQLHEQQWKKHLDEDREQWHQFIMGKHIVLSIEIQEFDRDHIKILQDMLNTAFPQTGGQGNAVTCRKAAILALDATSPRNWWSNSMLGYLAVQAKWKAEDNPPSYCREVSRAFVLHPAEIQNPLGIKIITLHRLFGFNTYVLTNSAFDCLYKQVKNQKKWEQKGSCGKKEFLLWEGEGCSRSLKPWQRGYRSYWDIDVKDESRKAAKDFDDQSAEGKLVKFRFFQTEDEVAFYKQVFSKVQEVAISCYTADHVSPISIVGDENKNKNRPPGVIKVEATDPKVITDILNAFAQAANKSP